jgi:NifU-like protein involved in Fe-S cluster formation
VGRAGNQACGDLLELGLWVEEGRIAQVRFRAEACSATVACASLACEALAGQTLEGAGSLDCADLIARAGGLPQGKGHAAELVARALAGALSDLGARYPGRAVDPSRAARPSVT